MTGYDFHCGSRLWKLVTGQNLEWCKTLMCNTVSKALFLPGCRQENLKAFGLLKPTDFLALLNEIG